jgi:hypothetical protein
MRGGGDIGRPLACRQQSKFAMNEAEHYANVEREPSRPWQDAAGFRERFR